MTDSTQTSEFIDAIGRHWQRHGLAGEGPMLAGTYILRVAQLLSANAESILRPLQLTMARFEVLVLLYFSTSGEMPLGKLGKRLFVHPASVTNTIDRLEEAGLVRRIAQAGDRRLVVAQITDEGRERTRAAAEAMTSGNYGLPMLPQERLLSITDDLREVLRGYRPNPPEAGSE